MYVHAIDILLRDMLCLGAAVFFAEHGGGDGGEVFERGSCAVADEQRVDERMLGGGRQEVAHVIGEEWVNCR
jgi:hypothetical protein